MKTLNRFTYSSLNIRWKMSLETLSDDIPKMTKTEKCNILLKHGVNVIKENFE